MSASPSLVLLRKRGRKMRGKRANRVTPAEIKSLLADVDAVPISRQLPIELRSQLRTLLTKISRRLAYLDRLQVRRASRMSSLQGQLANGRRLAATRDIDAQLAWLLDRKHQGKNVHAMAQGKRTAAKLGVEHYRRIGLIGAAVRWERERAKKAQADREPAPTDQ
jgi:hypothetical protein